MNDRIEKGVEIAAPVARVWRALTDPRAFGTWFGVELETPFVVGRTVRGLVTHPGYEHVVWQARIEAIETDRVFAFSWRPYAIDPNVDYSGEPMTRVEFTLSPTATGTHLRLVESGFAGIPEGRRAEAFRMNDQGWTQQMQNIRRYVESGSQPGDGPHASA